MVGIVRFNVQARVRIGKVGDDLLNDRKGGIISRRDAETDGKLVARVFLTKTGSEVFVEVWFKALDRTDNGDVRDKGRRKSVG